MKTDTIIDYKKISDLKAFFIHYKNHMGLFLLDMACALTVAGIDLMFPYVSKRCMEKYLPESMYNDDTSVKKKKLQVLY